MFLLFLQTLSWSTPLSALCFVKEMASVPIFWVPGKTGLYTGSHENKSVRAEIRGLLKTHSNSSQAPLVGTPPQAQATADILIDLFVVLWLVLSK